MTAIDRRYRHGATLASSAFIGWLGSLVIAIDLAAVDGISWGAALVALVGGQIAATGLASVGVELAKPCRPVDPDHGYTGPRSLRDDERGRAS